jgi:hypothetical protein
VCAVLAVALLAVDRPARAALPDAEALHAVAPDLARDVLGLALESVGCAQRAGIGADARRLAIIDYTVPSLDPRLWVFDLAAGALLFREHVAHGRATGEDLARAFSNQPGSHQSSLGLFLTQDAYQGRNGYSLRMDGLEPGVNDLARARAIVMHGADYVDPSAGRGRGRLGRSWGCPAVRLSVARPIIDSLAEGQFVFAYYPDREWLAASRLLTCGGEPAGGTARAIRVKR